MKDGQLQENNVDDNEHPGDATDGSHLDKSESELPQLSQKLTDSQEGSKEQPVPKVRTAPTAEIVNC
jgi:hypothetical protein